MVVLVVVELFSVCGVGGCSLKLAKALCHLCTTALESAASFSPRAKYAYCLVGIVREPFAGV